MRTLIRDLWHLFVGHHWRRFDERTELAPGVEQRYWGRRCRLCGWERSKILITGFDADGALVLRHCLEQLEAKLVDQGGRVTWHSGEAGERP